MCSLFGGGFMENGLLSLFDVTIEFDQSHLFFPRIVTWALLIMLGVIIIKEHKSIIPGLKRAGSAVFSQGGSFDRFRFFGTLALMVSYFYLMDVVGGIFPTRGTAFY